MTTYSRQAVPGSAGVSGAFYFPGQLLEISGGGTINRPSPFTAYVADRLLFSGGSSFSIDMDPTKSTVPIPEGLYLDGN